jgi:hypothetical protein
LVNSLKAAPVSQGTAAEVEEFRRVVAQLLGYDPDTWPRHGSWSLAVAASIVALKQAVTSLGEKLEEQAHVSGS